MHSGILYIATGERCCSEAILNANRSLMFNPGLSIAIKTDQTDLARNANIFTEIISFESPSYSYRDKIEGMLSLPFCNTLFLDSDACLIRQSESLFSILDSVDIAAASAPVRHPPGWTDSAVPLLFPELNTGVLLIRRSSVLNLLVKSWLDLYDSLVVTCSQLWDQASFRSVLWSAMHSADLRFLHLPSEMNLRTTKPWIAGRGMPVHVVHGRYPDEEFLQFVGYLNDDYDKFRTWDEWLVFHPNTCIRPRHDRTYD